MPRLYIIHNIASHAAADINLFIIQADFNGHRGEKLRNRRRRERSGGGRTRRELEKERKREIERGGKKW